MRFSLVFYLFVITTIVFAQSNTDDTSLFRGVENAIDESTEEDDAYRILKGLQDVSDEEESRENEDEDVEDIIEEEDEDEEEEEDDFSSNFPEFQNKETSEFFEHLPQPPTDNQNNEIKQEQEQQQQQEEDDDDEEEEEEPIEQEPKQQVNPFENDQFIPWKRPETMIKSDNTFYQDINFRETTSSKPSQFKSWHICIVFLVAISLYYRHYRKSHLSESSNSSWHNEKDYLPLHNNSSKLL